LIIYTGFEQFPITQERRACAARLSLLIARSAKQKLSGEYKSFLFGRSRYLYHAQDITYSNIIIIQIVVLSYRIK